MAKQHVNEAVEKAKELTNKYGFINLTELIEKYFKDSGKTVFIKEAALDEFTDILGVETSGVIMVHDDKIQIMIESSDESYRRRFTLAHEFGHLILGHRMNETPTGIRYGFRASIDSDNFGYGLIYEDEQAANAFAAELLMPYDILKDKAKVIKNKTKLANYFGVSTSALKSRLRYSKIAK